MAKWRKVGKDPKSNVDKVGKRKRSRRDDKKRNGKRRGKTTKEDR